LQYKIIALDLDDTLLGPDRLVGETARQVIKVCKEEGILPVVCTGRPYASAELFAKRLETEAPVIANNGAITRTYNGNPLREVYIEPELCAQIFKQIAEDHIVYVYTPNKTYTNKSHDSIDRYKRILETPIEIHPNLGNKIFSMPINAVGIRIDENEAKEVHEMCYSVFGDKAQIMISVPTLVEILPHGASKGKALNYLCSYLDIPINASMAVGDSNGDLDMIRVAGCGVLVNNANKELHHIADYVTEKPHTHGVLEALQRTVAQ